MKEVLIVSIGFSPNVGGIETHFDDLVKVLDENGWKTWVLTYKPLTTKVPAKYYEEKGKNIRIYRLPWLGNFFYKLVKNPLLEFMYLFPGLFCVLPIFLILKGRGIRTIDSHGLIAGFVSVFWGRIFHKKVITTTHSIYNFPKSGLYRSFASWIFNNSSQVLTLSQQSKKEIEDLGINAGKIITFTYWVNQNIFKKVMRAKGILGWQRKFVIFSVGRLIPEKGINELIEASKMWDKNVTLAIAGVGPLGKKIKKIKRANFIYLGKIDNDRLPIYYSAADLFIVPSIHEEGFGRTILESLSCGTPILGSDRGGIPEAVDSTVGKLIDVSPQSIKREVEYFYKNRQELNKLSKNTRKYALKYFSKNNAGRIIASF